jgi:hypothetical protein
MILQFGKYRGRDIEDVPDDYIQYMIESNEKSLRTFRDEKARREAMRDAKLTVMERIVQAGYRQLSLQNHPDHGGSTAAMQEINAAYAKLKASLGGIR